ncbi:hypothetical protein BDN70DRAFT_870925 [Pholiota conissans]|uniref:AAA+ ATPase domain-containing protein n=1 Tax=Pholiota conissans TaxID=109636 RepID=A0A9P5ZDV0_9AGAR|nr:hypothetical protein BDN70DRAFT_870925 [Pholiota conissans]
MAPAPLRELASRRVATLFTPPRFAPANRDIMENVQKGKSGLASNTTSTAWAQHIHSPAAYIGSTNPQVASMNSGNGKLRKTPPQSSSQRPQVSSVHWLFRSNIPRRRASYLSPDIRKRNFFGMGDIIGVLTNPAETVRSLTESRRLLEEARREINENKERSQIRTKHTFSRLPGFFPRKVEMAAIERALEGEPSFTILFGASSVGKTALLREVLSREEYHVLHFDLRIAGFADLSSLYTSLSHQMEQYFEEMAKNMEGYEAFEKEAWSFKHDRLNVERRFSDSSKGDTRMQTVKTSDVARLMELFQSSLLKYWEFQPDLPDSESDTSVSGSHRRREASTDTQNSNKTRVERASQDSGTKSRWGFKSWGKKRGNQNGTATARSSQQANSDTMAAENEKKKEKEKPAKKMPVIFFDEAHKLPALIQSTETMKCLLDSMLVLTKQDRLCHVIHATSDPFYQTWLRQFNVMQHCKIITIGDCSKAETRKFFRERVLPRVPERIRAGLVFEQLYDAFGGKIAHWHDYVTDYVSSNGTLDVKQSSHFLQAHSLLNLHIIHSSQALTGTSQVGEGEAPPRPTNNSTADTLHPGLGPAGFKIYSPLTFPFGPQSPSSNSGDAQSSMGINGPPEFSAMELLKVMSRFARPETQYIPYFHLCRELGVRTVDGMIKGRVLDLRWTEPVTKEYGEEGRVRSSTVPTMAAPVSPASINTQTPQGGFVASGSSTNVTPIGPPPPIDDDDDIVPVSEADMGRIHQGDVYEEVMEVIGPKLVPTTPVMRFAMRDVVHEYEDDQSVSEYASLSDVDEY